jgi:hypothetical protein
LKKNAIKQKPKNAKNKNTIKKRKAKKKCALKFFLNFQMKIKKENS